MTAVAALAIGWSVDRWLRKTDEDAIAKRERVYIRINDAHQRGISYFEYQQRNSDLKMKTEMVDALLLLWQEERAFNQAGLLMYSSEETAFSFMSMLECNSPAELRKLAVSLYRFQTEEAQTAFQKSNNIFIAYSGPADPPPNESYYPELHDESSDEYKSFEEFLARAFAAQR